MAYPSTCQRLRLGGTVSGSAITGGTLIETYGKNLITWNGMFGYPGRRGTDSPVVGVDGTRRNPTKRYLPRFITLSLIAYNRDDNNTIVTTKETHLWENMDELLELISGSDETVILERDMPDGSIRWIELEATQAASFNRGPLFNGDHASYSVMVPMVGWWPFWQTATQTTTAFATGFTPAGNAPHAPILSFTGNGRVTHNETGDYVEVAGATFGLAVVVDCQQRTVIQNALNVDNFFAPSGPRWLRLTAGTAATFTATAAGNFLRRGQYL